MAGGELQAALEAAVTKNIDGAEGIENLHRLTAGASQETWSFDAVGPDQPLPLILRRAPGGVPEERSTAIGQEKEAKLIQIAYEHGVKAPKVRFVCQPEDGLGVGFVMDRIEGETLAPRVLRDESFDAVRPKLAHQCGEVLAAIHKVPVEEVDWLRTSNAASQWQTVHDVYDQYFEEPSPVFEYAFRWVKERLPESPESRLVHGDFRNGNIMFHPQDGVRAVLDWEIAHLGDPMEDMGWICVNSWRFGRIDRPVGGFGEREDLFAGYEEAGGGKVDPERVRFWEVFGSLRWGVTCRSMAFTHWSGPERS
ncbi:MAG: phosphotransferase family protein, partial [Alphaproteobacteria bacterium]|nr:phosphotransferase family protein [Alphaproteobacteria bacterium]